MAPPWKEKKIRFELWHFCFTAAPNDTDFYFYFKLADDL